MQPVPYLFFNGTCAAAMTHYAEVFGTADRLVLMTLDAAPDEVRAQLPGVSGVMHAALPVGSGWIYASDDLGTEPSPAMAGCNIAVDLPDDAETRRVFDRLAEGGEVRMPLEPTFFAPLFGTLTDRFGTRWMVMTASPMPG
ncbi:VOC family protein [Pseudooceanicola sp. 216_PA32_1]|uniref:VOC family protein n=1 Tax=Pseudooceanicola pacificus TaxID=2676438 RepID=A0A844WDP5_9RHOB|nr:VOC family protein [Pseudooceanicola pacificus]MWB77860.1 VOC family protein [Pseudooceanicola pacificus]